MSDKPRTRVLVAEDDYLVCEEIGRTLKEVGFDQIGTASNGEKAVEMTRALRPDVVLMDIQMPKMDGLEAARQIQEHCPTPVVILTAFESQDLVEKASKAGVSAYLTKPPDVRGIERAVTIALARHGDLMKWRRLTDELNAKNAELEKAMAEVKRLQGIIPICCMCKKIRNDDGFWQQVETYVSERSDAMFSHGYCPECLEEDLRKQMKLEKEQ